MYGFAQKNEMKCKQQQQQQQQQQQHNIEPSRDTEIFLKRRRTFFSGSFFLVWVPKTRHTVQVTASRASRQYCHKSNSRIVAIQHAKSLEAPFYM
jgi:hypothetical protein